MFFWAWKKPWEKSFQSYGSAPDSQALKNLKQENKCAFLVKGAVSQNSAKLGNYKMPVKLRETKK